VRSSLERSAFPAGPKGEPENAQTAWTMKTGLPGLSASGKNEKERLRNKEEVLL